MEGLWKHAAKWNKSARSDDTLHNPVYMTSPAQECLKRKKAERREKWNELLMVVGFLPIILNVDWEDGAYHIALSILYWITYSKHVCYGEIICHGSNYHSHTQAGYLYFDSVGLICPLSNLLSVRQILCTWNWEILPRISYSPDFSWNRRHVWCLTVLRPRSSIYITSFSFSNSSHEKSHS